MRVLQLVDGDRWTGPAAVVYDQTAALLAAGVEAQFAFLGGSLLSARLEDVGWARPILRRPIGPLDYGRQIRFLRETLRREKFDLVHAHRSYDHTLAAFAVRGTGARLARTLHHVRHTRPDPFTALVYRRTDAFAFSNRAIADRFGRPGPVLPPVVDAERFRPENRPSGLRRRLGLPEDGVLVGTVGKMSAGRGYEEAIAAAAALPSVTLVHVGHGESMPILKKRAEALGAVDRNLWLGYQEELLPELYRAWDLFLFPASGADQGQRAILEAMASGLPVLAVDVPGVRDLMTDGVEGAVVADGAGLAAGLAGLAGSAPQRRRCGAAARTRSLAFTAAQFAPTALRFFDQILNRAA